MYSNSYTLSLDLKKTMANVVPVFVQDDTATLKIKVTDNGSPYDLSTADKYSVSLKRPDGVVVTGTGTFSNGLLTYQLGTTEMSIPGDLEVVAQFYSGQSRISCKPFKVTIIGDVQEDIPSDTAVPLIQQLQAEGDYAKAQGEALGYKGVYDATVAYKQNNIVSFNAVNYICIQDTTAGTDSSNSSYWQQISPMARINSQTWTATDGQTVFTLSNGSYVINSNNIHVTVGGVEQPPSAFTETNSTSFTLSEGASLNTSVYAWWFEGAVSISQTHHSTHEAGGQDELDVTKLKNYQEQIASPLASMAQNAFSKLMQDMMNGLSVTIDCHGDSTYHGYMNDGSQATTPAPLQLQNMLRAYYNNQNITVINNGLNGNQTTNALRTWDSDMQASSGQIIYMNYGINDSQGGNPVGVNDPKINAQQYYLNLKQLVSIARKNGKMVILDTPNPLTYDSGDGLGTGRVKTENIKQFAKVMRQVAMELNVPLVDNFMSYNKYIEGLQNIYNAFQPGGVHPTQAGYIVKGTNMALPLIHPDLPIIKSESFIPIGGASTQVDSPNNIVSAASRAGYGIVSTSSIRFAFFVDVPGQDIYIATPIWNAGDTNAAIKIDGSLITNINLNSTMVGNTGIGVDQEILIMRNALPGLHVLEFIGNSVGMYYLRSRNTRYNWNLTNDPTNNTITKRKRVLGQINITVNSSSQYSHVLLDIPTSRTLDTLDLLFSSKLNKNTGLVLFATPIGPNTGFSPHGGLYLYLNNSGFLCINEGVDSTGYGTETALTSADESTSSHIYRITVAPSGLVTVYVDGTQVGTYTMTTNRYGGFLGGWVGATGTINLDWVDIYS